MCWSADTTHGKAMTRCHNKLNLDTRICLTEDNTVQVVPALYSMLRRKFAAHVLTVLHSTQLPAEYV